MNNNLPIDQYIQKIFIESTHDIESINPSDGKYRSISLDKFTEVVKKAMDEGYSYGIREGNRMPHEVTV